MTKKRVLLLIIALLALVVFIFILFPLKPTPPKHQNKSSQQPLLIEGKVYFLQNDTNDTITSIDVAVADNIPERNRGLMYRYTMPDTVGMIFIFDEEDYLSFWMKNTHISLDIMYVNKNGVIVDIKEYTMPYSEEMIPSKIKSLFAVEVNAGFCQEHGIEAGDKILFRKLPAH